MEAKNQYQIIQTSVIKPHTKVYGEDAVYLQTEYERKTSVAQAKDKIQRLGRIPATPTVKYVDGECLCIAYYEYVLAASELGIAALSCVLSDVSEEDAQAEAIIITEHLEESFARMGREVPVLMDYVEKHWKEIKKSNPKLTRKKDWVASKIGYKSDDTVSKILEILTLDKAYVLSQVDSKELDSLEAAWKKATGKEKEPKESDLDKDNVAQKKCNCPLFKDKVTGVICPLFAAKYGEEGGGAREAA